MKQKFIEWFTRNNNGCSPAMEDDRSFVSEKVQHMFEAYQAGAEEGEARCAALAAELSSVLTDRAVILEDLDNTCFEIGMQRGEKTEAYPTPVVANHDAFLAEVRAQGVEMLAEHLSGMNISASETSVREFAAQLRKGVQS
ncbi:hypothetical protein ABKW07_13310 [Enterobacter kobei]|uniref:hypothetical protein n=1 Tax=Enterobacter kobei TaxID=208224 RepID=UPI0032B00DC8